MCDLIQVVFRNGKIDVSDIRKVVDQPRGYLHISFRLYYSFRAGGTYVAERLHADTPPYLLCTNTKQIKNYVRLHPESAGKKSPPCSIDKREKRMRGSATEDATPMEMQSDSGKGRKLMLSCDFDDSVLFWDTDAESLEELRSALQKRYCTPHFVYVPQAWFCACLP